MMTIKKKSKKLESILTVRFTIILSSMIILLSTSIIAVVIFQFYQSARAQSSYVKEMLETTETADQAQWVETITTYASGNNSPYYIRVVLDSNEVIYSRAAKSIYNNFSDYQQFIFNQNLLWLSDQGPAYYQAFEKNGAQISILMELSDTYQVIRQIIWISLLMIIILIVMGIFVIRKFSRRLSAPLVKMSQDIIQIGHHAASDMYLEEQVGITEIASVSKAFNYQLGLQRNALKREQQFVSDASHELRTPLAAIRGHVNLIKRRGEKHPEVIPKSIRFIDSESKRMSELVEQLLSLEIKLQEMAECDLNLILSEVISEMAVVYSQPLIFKHQQTIYLNGVSAHFYQIFRNLIENACKYSKSNSEVKIQLVSQGNNISFSVEDQGIGIPDALKANIFDRFYRVDPARSSAVSGSGIGLSIVKRLVAYYGGQIEVKDSFTGGSIFTVHLPK
ncbi:MULTISPECIES: HAMP domain-containing sensor histidine kinase [unclassified Enterococcus]|uniref:sensor histidine kinase n=1 Tax=unclassified Enterococcus TaxID=2608891 RepID=UPI0015545A73|nr:MULTISPECIES: HAMP domain-containing sensor histidine kinase [unclassified Enterococcus]MBS7577381.1 HAMP domain-containing histidine kinase [Enterococcus sp. MMGLQ5-2]MBS7584788.1 HAMP domain-containing histidine kinase [Enterococcus sp. MMGLQ5-1]NPD12643.1 HAMP domain-containing histidine kinase [Enterococcus sp. MMGLQ5-1]NPD37215.1 HAMP domain-containing histidine kinase [Enterococcus sp. MMGLQ5-2]